MRIYILSLFVLICTINAKSQSAYIDTDYKYIYVIKCQEITSPGSAKLAKKDFTDLFDSQQQVFSIQDSSITIRSAFSAADSVFIHKLNEYGYTVLAFSKNIMTQTLNSTKKRE